MALAQLETISPIKFGDSFPHMSGDTQPYVITCEGDDCTSVEFYNTTKGCNPILKLCPACNAKVKSAVDGRNCGESISSPSKTVSTLDHESSTNIADLKHTESCQQQEGNSGVKESKLDHHDTDFWKYFETGMETHAFPPPVHEVPPSNWRQLQGMFRVLLASDGKTDGVTITINDDTALYYRDDEVAAIQPQTFHFNVKDRKREKLYWFTEYAAIMTSYNLYVEYCGMSNGDIILGVWETRCARPFQAILVWRKKQGDVVLIKCKDYRQENENARPDPQLIFDKDEAIRRKDEYLVISRRRYDPKRKLHPNCRHPEKTDQELASLQYKKANPGVPVWAGDPEDSPAKSPPTANLGGIGAKRETLSGRQLREVSRYSPEKVRSRAAPKGKRVPSTPRDGCDMNGKDDFELDEDDDEDQLEFVLADEEVQEVESMLVKDLKAELRHREACVTGVKEDLVERLLELRNTDAVDEKKAKATKSKKSKAKTATTRNAPNISANKSTDGSMRSSPKDPQSELMDRLIEQQEQILELLRNNKSTDQAAKGSHQTGRGYDASNTSSVIVESCEAGRNKRQRLDKGSSAIQDLDEDVIEDFFESELEMQRLRDANAKFKRKLRLLHLHG